MGGYDLDNLRKTPSSPFETQQYNAYSYIYLPTLDNLFWTLGFSYNVLDQSLGQPLQVDTFNPKFGLQWRTTENSQLRMAAFKTFKPRLVGQQTIEPTQITGFNQFLMSLTALKPKLWIGLGFSDRQ